jgi:hypothetical protein
MEESKVYPISEWRGRRYGHLTIIDYKDAHFICKCDCGNIKVTKPSFLFNKKMTCCGIKCVHHQEQYDGRSKTRLFRTWQGMLQRCYNPNASSAKYYYDRGIKVCDEWRKDFAAFREWALANGYRDDLTIDRIDFDGNYEPSNCRWATHKEQNSHLRPQEPRLLEIRGERKHISVWAKEQGMTVEAIRYRVRRKGMTWEEAILTPKDPRGRKKKEIEGTENEHV